MKLIKALAPVCALLLPCVLAAETFEGKVTMKVTSSSSREAIQSLDLSLKEGYMRMDVVNARGFGGMVTDLKNRQIMILMPQAKMYMVRALPAQATSPLAGAGSPQHGTLKDTGMKETILGYDCTRYLYTNGSNTSDIWVTDQLGSFTGLFNGGAPGQPQAPQEWESALKGRNFFPMRVVTNTNGKQQFRLDVTSVEKTKLPDSLFTAPEGWRKFDLGNMMGGMGPGGSPGSRPADGNN